MTKKFDETVRKIRSYAAVPDAGFTTEGVEIPARGTAVILVRPGGGSLMRLTQREAEVWLSGYLCGGAMMRDRLEPRIRNLQEALHRADEAAGVTEAAARGAERTP